MNHVRANEQSQTDFECKSKRPFTIPGVNYPGKNEPHFTSSYTQKTSGSQESIFLSSQPRKMPEVLSE